MKIEEIRANAPEGATHYFNWCDDDYFFKRGKNGWDWWINNSWTDTDLLKIYWRFGWKCKTRFQGGPTHKLKSL